MEHHPATAELLDWFEYGHLPAERQIISAPFHRLAHDLARDLGGDGGPEMTVALRKLLEAKDCAVRAAIRAERVASERAAVRGDATAPAR